MNILNAQNVYDNVVVVQQVETDEGVVERVKQPMTLVGICHDPVNDTVMLIKDTPNGSLMDSERFPTVTGTFAKASNNVIQDYIESTTGVTVKAVEFIQDYMASPDLAYAPVQLFYVTFDSRTAEESDSTRLTTGKNLWGEVSKAAHSDINVIMGSHYLKMLHHSLIK